MHVESLAPVASISFFTRRTNSGTDELRHFENSVTNTNLLGEWHPQSSNVPLTDRGARVCCPDHAAAFRSTTPFFASARTR